MFFLLNYEHIFDAGDQPYQGQDPSWHLQLTTFRVQKNVAKQSVIFDSSSDARVFSHEVSGTTPFNEG